MTYPAHLPCPIVNAYGNKQAAAKKYLANKHSTPKPRVTVTLITESKQQMIDFADFYFNDLNDGTETFTAMWDVFGVDDYLWTFRIVGDISNVLKFSTSSTITFSLEVQDDAGSVVAAKATP